MARHMGCGGRIRSEDGGPGQPWWFECGSCGVSRAFRKPNGRVPHHAISLFLQNDWVALDGRRFDRLWHAAGMHARGYSKGEIRRVLRQVSRTAVPMQIEKSLADAVVAYLEESPDIQETGVLQAHGLIVSARIHVEAVSGEAYDATFAFEAAYDEEKGTLDYCFVPAEEAWEYPRRGVRRHEDAIFSRMWDDPSLIHLIGVEDSKLE